MIRVLTGIGALTVFWAVLFGLLTLVDRLPHRRRSSAVVVPLNARRVDRPHARVVPASRSTAASVPPRLAAVPTPTRVPAQRS